MKRIYGLVLLTGCALSLGGCVAGIAAKSVGMAVRSAQGTPQNNEQLQPMARQACGTHASQYGAVRIIDAQQVAIDKITVWGTVDDGQQRRSFECAYGTKIKSFKLRPIAAAR